MNSYTIQVTFTRDLEDDSDVLASKGIEVDRKSLIKQFCEELQFAYDEGSMSGDFDVTEIQLT